MIAAMEMFFDILWRRIRLRRFTQSEWLQMGYRTRLVRRPFRQDV